VQPANRHCHAPELSRGARLWIWLSYWLVGLFFRLISRLHIAGEEHIPLQGGVLLVSNHISWLDTLLIPYSVLRAQGLQIIWAPAKVELFRVPLVERVITSWGAFPVRRGKGDVGAMRRMTRHMQTGKLMLFPEGTRSRDGRLGAGKRMVGKLIYDARPIVIPTAVWGTDRVWSSDRSLVRLRLPVGVRYGEPLDLQRFYTRSDTKETAEAIVREVMGAIASLVQAGKPPLAEMPAHEAAARGLPDGPTRP
jgi:1-acyl-sn-glycerol-3-phosphate acyltransferase